MPRPRRDGSVAALPNKRKLNDLVVKKLKPQKRAFVVWDNYQRGLAVQVQPSGRKSWKCIYSFHGRPRWYFLGDVAAIDLSDAQRLASRTMFAVTEGTDPAAVRRAERNNGTFQDLATQYVEEHAKRHNRSWKQADALVRKHLLPRWSKLL
jgi:Arm DNA-binding domain